jgi:YHS domain-containing protein
VDHGTGSHSSSAELRVTTRVARWYQFSLKRLFFLITLISAGVAVYANRPRPSLEGYCPVTLVEEERWQKGEPSCSVVHRRCRYHFADETKRQRFMANPNKYVPAGAGYDVIFLAEGRTQVEGKRKHGCFYRGRVYLFSSEEALQKFCAAPDRYTGLEQGQR